MNEVNVNNELTKRTFKQVDLNSELLDAIPGLIESPEWFVCPFSPDWKNSPSYNGYDKSYGILLCFGLSSWWYQMAFCTTDSIVYIRNTVNESAWSSWKRLNN